MDSIIVAPITKSLVKINDFKNYLIVTAVLVTTITIVFSLRFTSYFFVVVTIHFLTQLASALLLNSFFISLRESTLSAKPDKYLESEADCTQI